MNYQNFLTLRNILISVFLTFSFLIKGQNTFSTKGHPKAKGVNLSIYIPTGWEAFETKYPNVVAALDNEEESIMITITDWPTFFSKEMAYNHLSSKDVLIDVVKGLREKYGEFISKEHQISFVKDYPILIVEGVVIIEQLGEKYEVDLSIAQMIRHDKLITFGFSEYTKNIKRILLTISFDDDY